MTGPQRLTSHVLSAIGIAVAFVLAAYLPGLAAWFQAGLAVMSAVTLLSLLNRNLQRKQRFIRLGFAIAMAVAAGLVPMLPGLVR
jgi:multisubunit Na+/H+ antiporter MnhB subunit